MHDSEEMAVRERADSPSSFGFGTTHYKRDIGWSLQEIDRLRAEVAALKANPFLKADSDKDTVTMMRTDFTILKGENFALKNGIAHLEAENSALKEKVASVFRSHDSTIAECEEFRNENAKLREALKLGTVATKLLEDVCPCGARPESLRTHPHVTGCLVVAILNVLRI